MENAWALFKTLEKDHEYIESTKAIFYNNIYKKFMISMYAYNFTIGSALPEKGDKGILIIISYKILNHGSAFHNIQNVLAQS